MKHNAENSVCWKSLPPTITLFIFHSASVPSLPLKDTGLIVFGDNFFNLWYMVSWFCDSCRMPISNIWGVNSLQSKGRCDYGPPRLAVMHSFRLSLTLWRIKQTASNDIYTLNQKYQHCTHIRCICHMCICHSLQQWRETKLFLLALEPTSSIALKEYSTNQTACHNY